ncbi:hypothetical protein [Algoriphagus yeomjeoni]|uniref:Uncharacterized protein n=1 Tax=Algoriphagus yeomjeoni TaxID=291403 RepID=A0A327P6C9_9BACT|nr:hypothetical protein [Algoriphagus yeomjeoni]RAI86967.1 hypothetical protein LV83_03071 [Algoriphagus yeomjeoni]
MSCFIEQDIVSNNTSWIVEVSITFLAFFLGLLSTFLLNRLAEKKKRKRLKNFYISWIEFSLESIERQTILLKNHVYNIEKNNFSKLEFNNNQIHKLKDINNEELFDAFVISNRGESTENSRKLHNLGNHIEFLITAITDIKDKFYDYRTDLKNWNEDWNVSFLEFGIIIDNYILTHKNNMGKNVQEIIVLKNKFNQFDKSDGPSTEYILKNFITPVRIVFGDHLHFDNDPQAKKGIEISDWLNKLSLQKSKQTESYTNNISNYCEQFEFTIMKIKEIIDYFKNQK